MEVMEIGEKIRKFRLARGMTQKELGHLSGLSEPAIRNYELGNRNVGTKQITKIANALNVGVASLADTNIETLGDVKALLLELDKYIDTQLDGELDSKGKYKTDTMSLTFKHPSIQKFLKEWADMKKEQNVFYDELVLMEPNNVIVKKDTQSM